MKEYLDILDEKGKKTGESRTKDEVHEQGLRHATVHVWFVNSKGQLLLQKRSKNMRAYPGYWYNSASGHISSGQSSLEAAQRETEEELGVSLSPQDFKYLFTMEEHAVLNGGAYIDNEFNDVYLVHCDLTLPEFKFEVDEVEQVRWISRDEFAKWIEGKGELLVPQKEEYKKLLKYLKNE